MASKNVATFYPETMKSLPNWVLWKLEPDAHGRLTKIPYSALYNGKASSTKPYHWTTFDKACEALRRQPQVYNGLGFMLGVTLEDLQNAYQDAVEKNKQYDIDRLDYLIKKGEDIMSGLVFIDLDHCIDTKTEKYIPNDFFVSVTNVIGKDTYYEFSQSETGIHIFCFGDIPENIHTKEIEMYNSARFCAMTGKAISLCEPSDKSSAVLKLYEKHKRKDIPQEHRIKPDSTLDLSDTQIIEYALHNEKTGDRFKKLMNGDYSDYPSQSQADFELCKILAFWCDRDYETIERIFSLSGLSSRSKWKRRKYREDTITKACDSNYKYGLKESLSEYIARQDEFFSQGLKQFKEARHADKQ